MSAKDRDWENPPHLLLPDVPFIDSRVELRGVSAIRDFNGTTLRELDHLVVLLGEKDERLAVLFPYDAYIKIQTVIGHQIERIRELEKAAGIGGPTQ